MKQSVNNSQTLRENEAKKNYTIIPATIRTIPSPLSKVMFNVSIFLVFIFSFLVILSSLLGQSIKTQQTASEQRKHSSLFHNSYDYHHHNNAEADYKEDLDREPVDIKVYHDTSENYLLKSSNEKVILVLLRRRNGGETLRLTLEKWKDHPASTLREIYVRDGQNLEKVQHLKDCHWKGYGLNEEERASFVSTSCNHEDEDLSLPSFTGVLTTPEGLWLLKPHPQPSDRRKRDVSQIHGTPHLLIPLHKGGNNTRTFSDALHVPLPQLEAASLQYIKDYEIRHPLPHPQSKRKRRKAVRRASNSNSSKKWVEIAVFTDPSLYLRMSSKYPNDTLGKLRDYANTMITIMDLLYGDKSLGVEIGFRLVHLEIMKKATVQLDPSEGKAKAYLTSFCEYAGGLNNNSGRWDHALLLTGLDLHEEGLRSTAGLAWAGTMCFRYYSCSIAEGWSYGAAYIITHEIGHSLGIEHDGAGISSHCDKDKYIMSPTTGPGKVTWSNCSGKNLEDFIKYGTSELRNTRTRRGRKAANILASRPYCLTELVNNKGPEKTAKSLKYPGEEKDAFFQCQMGLGKQYKPYFQRNKEPFNNICWMLYCGNGTHAISTHPALEGTKCDKDKYCRRGQCIKRPKR